MNILFANSLFIKGKDVLIERVIQGVSHQKEIEGILEEFRKT